MSVTDNDSPQSLRAEKIGAAIAEYLLAVDSGAPLDKDLWLEKYCDLRTELGAFLQADSDWESLLATPGSTRDGDGTATPSQTGYETADSDEIAIEGYEVLEALGRGGMGSVYRARQVSLDRFVALKIPHGLHLSSDDRRRFEREADAVAMLDHPHIVPIFDVGKSRKRPFLAMKLFNGGTLRQLGKLEPQRAASLMISIADAIEHAHQRGILHRDLKPSNVMLDDQGHPIVTDFGLAKQLDREMFAGDETTIGTMLGTPAYMAPEQVVGEATTLSDVYSLGAILYSMLTGVPPFTGSSPIEVVEKVRSAAPLAPSKLMVEVPKDLETICLKCLNKSPEARYQSPAELAADLRRWLNHEPIVASPPTPWARLVMWSRRRPALAGLSVALMATVFGSSILITSMLMQQISLRKTADKNAEQALASAEVARTERNRVRETLNAMTSSVATEWLGSQQELTDSQQRFIRRTLAYYEDLQDGNPDAPEDLLWVAQAQRRLSQLLTRLGDVDQALASINSADDALNRLPVDFEPLQVGLDRMSILLERSVLHQKSGESEASLADIQKSVAIGRELQAENPDSIALIKQLSSVLSELGSRLRSRRAFVQAAEFQQESVELMDNAIALAGKDLDLERQLGIRLLNLGNILWNLRKPDESRAALERSLAIRRELQQRHPELWQLQADLVYTLVNLGSHHFESGSIDEARTLMNESVTLCRLLIQEQPLQEEVRRNLLNAMTNLSHLESQVGDVARAERILRTAITVGQQAMSDFPRIEDYRFLVTQIKNRLAGNLAAQHRTKEAIEILNEVISSFQFEGESKGSLQSRDSDEFQRAVVTRAGQLSELGRHDEALVDWDTAIAMVESVDPKKSPGLVLCRATTLVKRDDPAQGDSAEAKKLVENLLRETRSRPAAERDYQVFYNSACVLSLLGSKSADSNQADSYASQAIELLEEALREGLPWKESIRRDPELEFLRNHPKYAEIIGDD
jgi:tetratricopeptide (TPR) repeat protein